MKRLAVVLLLSGCALGGELPLLNILGTWRADDDRVLEFDGDGKFKSGKNSGCAVRETGAIRFKMPCLSAGLAYADSELVCTYSATETGMTLSGNNCLFAGEWRK
jgi:hypothetical protein